MPLQNRVLPTGEVVIHPARGNYMGNRGGVLHDSHRHLTAKRWASKAWITCLLDFKGRRRALMAPGRYTELFFLDEAVALAAGHRPCAECRRADYRRFRSAFEDAVGPLANAAALDAHLHAARVTTARQQLTHQEDSRCLPDGSFITVDAASWLVQGDSILRFVPGGYSDRRPRPDGVVTVLTPAPTVAALAAGYQPQLHHTARG